MECFVSEGSLAGDVSRDGGRRPSASSASPPTRQSFAQTIAIVDNLPDGDALLVVGLAPMRFTVGARATTRVCCSGARCPWSARASGGARGPGVVEHRRSPSVLPGAFDYLSAYLRARPEDGLGCLEEIGYEPHYWDGQPAQSAARRRSEAEDRVAVDGPLYARHGAYNLGHARGARCGWPASAASPSPSSSSRSTLTSPTRRGPGSCPTTGVA